MKKVLGLDLGTTSIGWSLVNEAEDREKESSSIEKMGVRVVPYNVDERETYQAGKDVQTNAGRTKKRSMRCNLQRFKLRRQNLIDCLRKANVISDDFCLGEDGPATTFRTLRSRAKAASEKISLDEFARVLLMINGKRGYKSCRKVVNQEDGALIDGMATAKELQNRGITPGQKVLELIGEGKKYVPDFYRSDLKTELARIWEVQKYFYPEILTEDLYTQIQRRSRNDVSKIFYARYNVSTAQCKGTDRKTQSYRWRVKALTDRLPIEEVAYVICELCGQISGSSNYLASISDRSKELCFSNRTIGQYLLSLIESNPHTSLKKIVFYRQDYLNEFERIWEVQQQYHPELTDELRTVVRDYCIFYQRPLRSQHNMIANCEFEHKTAIIDGKEKIVGMKVCPKSSPLYQCFRIWQVLNNIIVRNKATEESFPLALDQKQLLAQHLQYMERMTKSEALRLLFGKQHRTFDLNYGDLVGNETIATLLSAMKTIFVMTGHDDINAMSIDDALVILRHLGWNPNILEFDPLVEGKALEQQTLYRLWHLLYSYEGDNSPAGNDRLIVRLIEMTGIPEEYIQPLVNVSFKDEYGNLCSKAIRKILPHMMDGLEYSVACEYAGYRHSAHSLTKEECDNRELLDQLPLLSRNCLHNPVVEKILNQMIHVVNGVCQIYGRPDEIRIELARELKKSKVERLQMTQSINHTTKENEAIVKILQAAPFNLKEVSRNDIIRYRLYEELRGNGYHTLYTNTYIPKEALFTGGFDIEHIIPQSRLFDDSFANKTLEIRKANEEKAAMTALDYVSAITDEAGVEQYRNRVEAMLQEARISRSKRDKLLMRESDIPLGFLNRDLSSSQYIAHKAVEILEQIARVVTATTGSITARLREDWQIVDIMQELNWDKYDRLGMTYFYKDHDGRTIGRIKDWTKRNDHRHHAMDAVTIAFTNPAIIQYLNNMAARSDKGSSVYAIEKKYLMRVNGKLRFIPPMPIRDFRAAVKQHLESIFVSQKAKNRVMTKNTNRWKVGNEERNLQQLTPRGELHNETVYGLIKQPVISIVKLDKKMTVERAQNVTVKRYREAILARLAIYGDDPQQAFCGENTVSKNPIYLDDMQMEVVPSTVRVQTMQSFYVVRKVVDPSLNVNKVVDTRIKVILMNRLEEYGGDPRKAFVNLEVNPIWLNKEKGLSIKRVKVYGPVNARPLHNKHDHNGKAIHDKDGNLMPSDYVWTSNNHHAAFYVDKEGKIHDEVISFWTATERLRQGEPVVDKSYRSEDGWSFLFSLKKNEYFVFPDPEEGFDPTSVDLRNPDNAALVSRYLYRVQSFSKSVGRNNNISREYLFRHHLETSLNDAKALKNVAYRCFKELSFVKCIVRVKIDHLGRLKVVDNE